MWQCRFNFGVRLLIWRASAIIPMMKSFSHVRTIWGGGVRRHLENYTSNFACLFVRQQLVLQNPTEVPRLSTISVSMLSDAVMQAILLIEHYTEPSPSRYVLSLIFFVAWHFFWGGAKKM